MALGYQARALLRGLAKLGEPSLLAGVACGPVAIERDAEVFAGIGDTADDNPVVRRVVASIAASYAPTIGQALVHPSEGAFVLDRLLEDNGVVRRFVVAPG